MSKLKILKSKILFFALFLYSTIFAQEKEIEPIQTDRPDQTETPSLTPKGMLQVETGFSFQKMMSIVKQIFCLQLCGNMVLMKILNYD